MIDSKNQKWGSRLMMWASDYWRSFSFVGLVFATLFFSASVTPSLLPRHYFVQGLQSGFALAIGYGVGVACVWLWQFLELPKPSPRLELLGKRITTVAVGIVFVVFVRQMTFWQNSIRELMEMQPLETADPYRTALIAIVTGIVFVAFARLLGWCFSFVANRLTRFLPQRVSYILSGLIVYLAFLFLLNDVVAKNLLNTADRFFAQMDAAIDDGVEQPQGTSFCGSAESHIPWDTIGRRGKNFIVQGPTAEELAEFLGREAMQPIRVYAGLRSAETLRERAELALEELKRIGAFDRSLLIVATPTGTGWLDPSAVNPLEYLHGGDTAIVSVQYSYLPSWLSILVDPNRSKDSAQILFDEVYDYWTTLPQEDRPKLYLHGLSLGALGSESTADLLTTFEDPIQGAVWSGSPFPSTQVSDLTRARNEDSPVWLPKIRDGAMIRFTSQKNMLDDGRRWGPIRCVYIQYASDPMVFFSPNSLLEKPPWLNVPRGPDVSSHLRWYPLVTFLQTAFDLPMATSIPLGYGHNYSPSSYIDAWMAVTVQVPWSVDETKRLKNHFLKDHVVE